MYNNIYRKLSYFIKRKWLVDFLYAFIIFMLDGYFYLISSIKKNLKSKKFYSDDYNLAAERLNEMRSFPSISSKKIIRDKHYIYDLSIVIPVYNGEEYIANCINSIVKQSSRYRIQIIVINDGSTDCTLEIIEQFHIIEHYTQKNLGISAARNKGLELSRGKYIMFVDSDDMLIDKTIDSFLDYAFKYNIDIIEGNFLYETCQGKRIVGKNNNRKFIYCNINEQKDLILKIQSFPWGKMYKAELWKDINFPIGLEFEDTIIKTLIYRKSISYIFLNEPIYIYKDNNISVSKRLKGTIKGLDTLYIIQYIIEENNRLNLIFDDILYELLLNQMGYIMYTRNKSMNYKQLQDILLFCGKILNEIEAFCPENLTYKNRCLKKAILTVNVEMWIFCCKFR